MSSESEEFLGLSDISEIALANRETRFRGSSLAPTWLQLDDVWDKKGDDQKEAEAAFHRTEIGKIALDLTAHNIAKAVHTLDQLVMDILHDMIIESGAVSPEERVLSLMRTAMEGPILLVLHPDVKHIEDSEPFTFAYSGMHSELLARVLEKVPEPYFPSIETRILIEALGAGQNAIEDLLYLAKPKIILSRKPKMVPLCVPDPYFRIMAGAESSTAGILCRDADGEIGVTACYHGTGPVDTDVMVDLHDSYVKHADRTQDVVFIPLRQGLNLPELRGQRGVLVDRAPAEADHARFCGASSGPVQTRVQSHDAGLLRVRPTVQLKLQTPPDTNTGDSGCALLSASDEVLGFAFERTDYEDFPQFTDWIWAANALRALNLTPFSYGD